jgi:hypothetical protein
MELKNFLKNHFDQLTEKDVDETDDITQYEKFNKFICSHYSLDHLREFNYIKYVKVQRQVLKLKDNNTYMKYINSIDELITLMHQNNVFPNLKIKNYMYKTDAFFKIIEDREKILIESSKHIRSILKDNDDLFNMKIMYRINTVSHRYRIFMKNSKILKNTLKNLIKFEESYAIDHKLININNIYRSFMGKKSEYVANKVIEKFINQKNSDTSNKKKYFYETNINLFKLLNITPLHIENAQSASPRSLITAPEGGVLNVQRCKNDNSISIKGEIDGLIISYDGSQYIIETIIEVKSSVKATFDDTHKFTSLQDFIKNMNISQKIQYENYVFTEESFSKIKFEKMSEWVIYICINNVKYDIIEKSHFYFSDVLKIIDDQFINSFYIENNDNSIRDKHNIILQNRDYVNELYSTWKDHINLGKDSCNMFMTKII